MHKKELSRGGEEKGGIGVRGLAEELKHEAKKEFRQRDLSESEVRREPLEVRGGTVEGDLRRDLTKDQNLSGEEESFLK